MTKPLNQKILEEEILADVRLVAANGTSVKAHKVFLASQSSVFSTLFTPTENVSDNHGSANTVEMPEMTEESVRAFLRYLYYEDATVKDGGIDQVFELYTAANKYHVQKLGKLMHDTVLAKPDDWFELDTTLKLFMFARNADPVDKEVEMKAVHVLKTMSKKLTESKVYQDLFKKNMAAAMELCQLALSSD